MREKVLMNSQDVLSCKSLHSRLHTRGFIPRPCWGASLPDPI